jgi:putative SOS response-associated peptidase YedK
MLWTMSILTVDADGHAVFKRMHQPEGEKRMVIIMDPSEYDDWLSCSVEGARKYFRQWTGRLDACAAPSQPSVPKWKAPKPPQADPGTGELF